MSSVLRQKQNNVFQRISTCAIYNSLDVVHKNISEVIWNRASPDSGSNLPRLYLGPLHRQHPAYQRPVALGEETPSACVAPGIR